MIDSITLLVPPSHSRELSAIQRVYLLLPQSRSRMLSGIQEVYNYLFLLQSHAPVAES